MKNAQRWAYILYAAGLMLLLVPLVAGRLFDIQIYDFFSVKIILSAGCVTAACGKIILIRKKKELRENFSYDAAMMLIFLALASWNILR